MSCVSESAAAYSNSSGAARSEPFPNETTFENRMPRLPRPQIISPAFAPDWEIPMTLPGSVGWFAWKAIRSSGTYSPRQFGPMMRIPAARARVAIARSVAAISGSPDSENPAVKKCSERTPFWMHWSTRSGAPERGIMEMT